MIHNENNVKKMKKIFYPALIVLFLGTSMSLSSFSFTELSDLKELTSLGSDIPCVKKANTDCRVESTGNIFIGYGVPPEPVDQ
ncbi:hypothetical protein [Algoriphagus terrigena]|uniref:hypothetical protein n=1 Tax=Algoriphagus terrigena TaxID=344884 RepID=UPI00047994F4|nr:hypothetical protein [Algoriphagus terrigena]